jgi:hypothetical protein
METKAGNVVAEGRIDGHSIQVPKLLGMQNLELLVRLGKVMGPTLMPILEAFLGKGQEEGMKEAMGALESGKLAPAVGIFFDRLSVAELKWLAQFLLEQAVWDNEMLWDQYDLAFQGEAWLQLKVLWFALEANLKPFTHALPGKLKKSGTGPTLSSAG